MERSAQKVNELVENSVRDLSKLVNVDTVIGTPILTASGVQIIPVTKVTMGFLSGGSDIGETKVIKEKESVPFAGGSGAVMSLKPAGFLKKKKKNCRYIHAGDDPLDNLIDKASDLLKGFADAGE